MKNQRTLEDNEIKNHLFTKPAYLTLFTYNIWFEDHNSAIRYPCIFKMIEDSKADIVCLQEVNRNFLDILHQSAKYLKEY
jgi:endonuclease/exonuclease/phosphatase family metal-dependent hydrolase